MNSLLKNKTTIILTILVIAAFLRLFGIDFGQPYLYHPDEIKLTAQAGRMLSTKFMQKEAYFGIQVYPPFYPYLLAGVLAIHVGTGLLTGQYASLNQVQTAFEQDPFVFFLWSRMFVALLGVLTVLWLYHIGKKLYSEKIGIIAALLLSVNFLHVRHSHFGTVDAPAAFFGTLCMLGCVLMMQSHKTRFTLLTAACVSLAVATKFSMLFLLLPFLWAHFSQAPFKYWPARLKDKQLWIGAATGIATFLIACPLIWLDFNETWGGILGTHRFEKIGKIGSGGGFLSYWTGNQAPGFGVFYPNSIPETMGILLMIAIIVGIILMIIKHRKSDILLLLFMIPTYWMFEDMSIKAMRHILPLTPFFMIAAALAMQWLFQYIKKKKPAYIIGIGLLLFISLENFSHSIIYFHRINHLDPRTRAAAWINENITSASAIVLESFPPPVPESGSPHRIEADLLRKSSETTDNLVTLLKSGNCCYYISDDFTRQTFNWSFTKNKYPEITKDRIEFFNWLEKNGTRVKSFESKYPRLQPGIIIYQLKPSG